MTTFDPLGALRTLGEHEVRFIVIGGLAASALGSPSITDDLDICHDREHDNLERLAEALNAMEASLRGAPPDLPFLLDAKSLKAGMNFTFWTMYGPLDCLGEPAGVGGYAELSRSAEEHDLLGFPAKICSIEDLILMKEAAGRPKDRIELEVLAALKEEREKS